MARETEDQAVERILQQAELPRTFENLPLKRATNERWPVLPTGDYDGLAGNGNRSAAQGYNETALSEGKLPLNQWVEWPGMMDAITAHLKGKVSPAVFELGGGNGRQMAEICLRFRPGKAVFIENSREMLNLAQERLTGLGVITLQDSAENGLVLLTPASYDLGVASLVMHYLSPEQLARFYWRLPRVLKPQGVFLFTGGTAEFQKVLHPNVPANELRNATWAMFDTQGKHIWEMRNNTYFPEDHKKLAEAAGLRISFHSLKSRVPQGITRKNSPDKPWDLLYSPVWNLYKISVG